MAASLCLALSTPAAAGDGIKLPVGEDPADWKAALDLAGLTARGGGVAVRIEVVSGMYVVRAVSAQGDVRTARVAIPASQSDREDVAFLARSLLRELEALAVRAPDPLHNVVAMPPPPPSLRVATSAEPVVRVISVRQPPRPAPSPPDPSSDDVDTVSADVVSKPGTAEEEPEVVEVAETLPEAVPVLTARPPVTVVTRPPSSTRRRFGLETPPLHLTTATTFRPGHRVGLGVGLGVDLARWENVTGGFEFTYVAPHSLQENLQRNVDGFELHALAMAEVGERSNVGPIIGFAYRTFRQQNVVVAEAPMPSAGGRVVFAPIATRRVWVAFLGQLSFDLGAVEIVRDDQSSRVLSPFEGRLGLTFGFLGSRDPFGPPPTWME